MSGYEPQSSPVRAILVSMARVLTDNAHRLLLDASKRWECEYSALVYEHCCTVVFPPEFGGRAWSAPARVTLIADAQALNCWVDAAEVLQLYEIIVIIERELNDHLLGDRTLAFDWYIQG